MKNAGDRVLVMRKWIKQNLSMDREELIAECERKFGLTRKQVRDDISRLRQRGEIQPTAFRYVGKGLSVRRAGPSRRGRLSFRTSVDISDLKREYDEEAKIAEGLEQLGTRLIKDNDFRMELSVPADRWKVVSNLQKFSDNKKELKGKRFRGVYWGRADVVKELAKAIDIL